MEREPVVTLNRIRKESQGHRRVVPLRDTLGAGELIVSDVKVIVIFLQFEKRRVNPNARATRNDFPSCVDV